MPKFVLAPGATPLDHLTSEKISDLISQLTGLQEKFEKDSYSYDEKWALYNQLSAFGGDNGWALPKEKRDEYIGYFKDLPKTILIPAGEVEHFVDEMEKLRALVPAPDVNEFAFRFHLGKSSGKYSAVCVPMYGQKPVGGVPSSRENEQEKTFFKNNNKTFFALLFKEGLGSGYSTEINTCAKLIENVDKSGKKVAYFTENVFSAFYNAVRGKYENMRLEFARKTDNGDISLVLSFLDRNGNEVECRTMHQGQRLQGIFFDQGDLIPPPPTVGDLRDTFFPR